MPKPPARKPRKALLLGGLGVAVTLVLVAVLIFALPRVFSGDQAQAEQSRIADLEQRPVTGWSLEYLSSADEGYSAVIDDVGDNRGLVTSQVTPGYAVDSSADSVTESRLMLFDASTGEAIWEHSAQDLLPQYNGTGSGLWTEASEEADAALVSWTEYEDPDDWDSFDQYFASVDLNTGDVNSVWNPDDQDVMYTGLLIEDQAVFVPSNTQANQPYMPLAQSRSLQDLDDQLWVADAEAIYIDSEYTQLVSNSPYGALLGVTGQQRGDSETAVGYLRADTGGLVEEMSGDSDYYYQSINDLLIQSDTRSAGSNQEVMVVSEGLEPLWERPQSVDGVLTRSGKLFTVQSGSGSNEALMRVDVETGENLWERSVSVEQGWVVYSDDERTFFASSSGGLTGLDSQTGEQLFHERTENAVRTVYPGDEYFYLHAGGELSAHEWEDGRSPWQWSFRNEGSDGGSGERLVRVGDYLILHESSRNTLTVLE